MQEHSHHPIGFFDSGLGGITIWREVNQLLPNESTIYLADSINAPYGNKSQKEIIRLSQKNTEFLIEQKVKCIIVACNTATTNAIEFLRNRYPQMSFIGVEPAIKPAIQNTKTKHIGVLATQGTLSSEKYIQHKQKYPDIIFHEQIGYNLVQIIEKGDMDSEDLKLLLIKYLHPMVEAKVDQLVLGCTHYPLLKPIIQTIIPNNITILDSGAAIAQRLKQMLTESHSLCENSSPTHKFHTNSNLDILKKFVSTNHITKKTNF